MFKKVVTGFENKFSNGINNIAITIVNSLSLTYLNLKLIKASLIFGYFPCNLKTGKVIPLCKKGNENYPWSYRLLSKVLSMFSKILEKLVFNQISDYFEGNHLLNDEQHGFRQGRSLITASENCIEKNRFRRQKWKCYRNYSWSYKSLLMVIYMINFLMYLRTWISMVEGLWMVWFFFETVKSSANTL